MGQAIDVRYTADKPEASLILEQRGTSKAAISFHPASSSQFGPCISAMHAQRYGDVGGITTYRKSGKVWYGISSSAQRSATSEKGRVQLLVNVSLSCRPGSAV
jgi:hypothetical protein